MSNKSLLTPGAPSSAFNTATTFSSAQNRKLSTSTKKKTGSISPGVTDRLPCYIYRRVSTVEQFDSGLGLEAQLVACQAYAERQGYDVAGVFTEEGVSGAAPLSGRPALLALFSALSSPAVVLVAKRDRLGRDVLLVQLLQVELERRGARVESAAGEGNGSEPADKLLRTIVDGFSEFERDSIKARTKAALAVKKSRAERVGAIPYGAQLAKDGVHLEVNPEELKTLQLARALWASGGLSLRQVAKRLAEAGRLSRANTEFSAMQIKRMVDV